MIVKRGASPRPINDDKWFENESNIGWLRISDIKNTFLERTSQYLSKLGSSKTIVVPSGELIMSICGTLGKIFINKINVGLPDSFVWLKSINDNYDKKFLMIILGNYNYEKKLGQPGSQLNLNSNLISEISINIPSLSEQQKIAKFFYLLDKQISLWERKLELYELFYKYYLNYIFNITKFIINKFSRIINIFDLINGKASEQMFTNNITNYKVISIGNFSPCSEYINDGNYINNNSILFDKKFIPKKDDLVMVLNDKTHKLDILGKVILIDANDSYYINQRTLIMRNKICDLNHIYYHYFKSNEFRRIIHKIAQIGNQSYVNFSDISNIKIQEFNSRNVKELKINNIIKKCLSNIMKIQKLLEEKLKFMRVTKKYYQRKMFI
ncbi:restriction endonuclease subunit S [Malacoplasma muris]|uniref:restriction endonuclease subunit S n=1 Tax=Malacoplasma muris TaxID=2119 RepID=UPI00398E4A25